MSLSQGSIPGRMVVSQCVETSFSYDPEISHMLGANSCHFQGGTQVLSTAAYKNCISIWWTFFAGDHVQLFCESWFQQIRRTQITCRVTHHHLPQGSSQLPDTVLFPMITAAVLPVEKSITVYINLCGTSSHLWMLTYGYMKWLLLSYIVTLTWPIVYRATSGFTEQLYMSIYVVKALPTIYIYLYTRWD